MIRVGIGYDVHKLVEGRKLILGGEIISADKGLLGHSDADCLIHAIIDAILGAISQGDIGKHFPDTNEKYKDISSLKLLSYTKKILDKNKFVINNIDSTVIMQTPKIAKHIPQMEKNIADVLCIEIEKINIKATTEEGLGFTGKNEGVACQAICCVEKIF